MHTRECATACSLSAGGAARALAACARCAALIGVGLCFTEVHCASDTALFLGARPCSDVPAVVASNGVRVCAHANAPPRAFSRHVTHHARLWRLRDAPRWLESVPGLPKPTAPAIRPFPSTHCRALTCQPRPPKSSRRSRVGTHERATRCSHSGVGAARARAACARRVALVGVGPRPTKARCTSEAALSHGARSYSDVPAAASSEQPAFACAHTQMRHCVLSLGRRRSTCACGVRALRALVGVGSCLTEAHCASETALFLGARPCSDVSDVAANGVRVCAHANAPPRALSRQEAQHVRLRLARAAPR